MAGSPSFVPKPEACSLYFVYLFLAKFTLAYIWNVSALLGIYAERLGSY